MRVVIIGGGPAGYAAAQTACALGARVTLIEADGLGGNATLWDAIPSKTLLSTATTMATVERADAAGIAFEHGRPHIDLPRTIAHARYVAKHQSRGTRDRLEGLEVEILIGTARLDRPGSVTVSLTGGERAVDYDRLLIAAGAAPWEPPFAPVDHDRVFTPRDVLRLRRMPEHLLVVGAGATGCEYTEFFQSCGARVTLLSARDQIMPGEDRDVAEIVEEAFLSRGVDLQFGFRATEIERADDHVAVTGEDGRVFTGSDAIMCMGMRASTADLQLHRAGVEVDERGAIVVDDRQRTTADGIFAAGDVAGGMMLASTAAMQGRHAMLVALGASDDAIELDSVPWTIFTRPEVASVGLTERRAADAGRTVAVTKHYLAANPRGAISGWRDGVVKLVTEGDEGTIVGASIAGYRASEMITTLALAVAAGISAETLAETGTVTPSMSESLQRAAERAVNARLRVPARP